MPNLIDRVKEFIDWLENNTDFSDWDQSVKNEVHNKLLVFMISEPLRKEHTWTWYMNGTFCSKCGVAIGSNLECK